MDASNLNAFGINIREFYRILHSLAYQRVLATYCTGITNHADLFFEPWIVTRVEIGANIPKDKFDAMVASEGTALIARFCQVLNVNWESPDVVGKWLVGANKARLSYARIYQKALDDVAEINADSGWRLSQTLVAASIAQCAGELALIGVGAFPVNMIGVRGLEVATMTVATAVEKVAISVGATTAISVLDNWNLSHHDLAVAVIWDDAKASIQSLPGTGADAIEATLQQIQARIIRKTLSEMQKARPLRGGSKFLKQARTAATQNLRALQSQTGTVTKVGYLFALWSAYDSTVKLCERITDNKRFLGDPSGKMPNPGWRSGFWN